MKIHVTLQINTDTRSELESFCEEIGMTISAAFNILARTVARNKCLPDGIADVPAFRRDAPAERINILMDKDAREAFYVICWSSGTNMTAVVNQFARILIRDQRFPFDLTTIPQF